MGCSDDLEANRDSSEKEDRELMMRLAPLYQEEKAKARQEGFEQGILEGIREGKAEGIREGEARGEARGIREGEARGEARGKINLILRLLNRKFGNLDPNITEQIRQLSLEKLETLAESLLDFNTQADLDNWLTDNLSS